MAVDILYFAWVRERIGIDQERCELPRGTATVADLMDWLAARGGGHAEAFADRGRIRAAIDQRFASADASLVGAREIAFFPPVTGG